MHKRRGPCRHRGRRPIPSPAAESRGTFAGRRRGVTVVSNDSRLHEAARRAGSAAWGSQEFLDWVIATERPSPEGKAATPEKPDGPADAAEVTDLLRAFGEPKPRG